MADQQSALSLAGSKVPVCSFPCLDSVGSNAFTQEFEEGDSVAFSFRRSLRISMLSVCCQKNNIHLLVHPLAFTKSSFINKNYYVAKNAKSAHSGNN